MCSKDFLFFFQSVKQNTIHFWPFSINDMAGVSLIDFACCWECWKIHLYTAGCQLKSMYMQKWIYEAKHHEQVITRTRLKVECWLNIIRLMLDGAFSLIQRYPTCPYPSLASLKRLSSETCGSFHYHSGGILTSQFTHFNAAFTYIV